MTPFVERQHIEAGARDGVQVGAPRTVPETFRTAFLVGIAPLKPTADIIVPSAGRIVRMLNGGCFNCASSRQNDKGSSPSAAPVGDAIARDAPTAQTNRV